LTLVLDTIWGWAISTADLPALPLALAAAAAGILVGLIGQGFRPLRLVPTWVHESGHALMALILGRHVTGIVINPDTSGVTESLGRKSRLEQALVAFSGYPAPAIVGSTLLYLTMESRINLAILLAITMIAIMLLLQRSLLGCALSLTFAVGVVGLIYAPSLASLLLLAALAGYLLSASPIAILELSHSRKMRAATSEHSDADTLATLLVLPASAWEALFLLVSLSAPAIAIRMAYG